MPIPELFRDLQKIYCICPCCGNVFRLSKAKIFVGSPPRRTVFDEIEEKERKLSAAEDRFSERESSIKEEARQRGEMSARRRLRIIARGFLSHRIDPNDVKTIFSPVEYVVFSGYSKGRCTRVEFVDLSPESLAKERVLKSLNRAIERGNISWSTYRIDGTGLITVER